VRSRRKERFARSIQQRGRVVRGPSVRAACGGNLSLTWLSLSVAGRARPAVGSAVAGAARPAVGLGVTQVVLAVGRQAGIEGLRPHRLRHNYATRLRQGGADVAQVQALVGHASVETAGRCFRAGTSEQAAVVERVFE
jgi:integrase